MRFSKKPLVLWGRADSRKVIARSQKWKAGNVKPKTEKKTLAGPKSKHNFQLTNGWTYFDGHFSPNKHLILFSQKNEAVHTLGFHELSNSIMVVSIQAERTQLPKEALNNEHPSEIVVSEFIRRMKPKMKQGKRICLSEMPVNERPEIYKPIIERFFKSTPTDKYPGSEYNKVYELNPEKKRVKEIMAEKEAPL